jgi:uncharacterized protein (DUF885 family)
MSRHILGVFLGALLALPLLAGAGQPAAAPAAEPAGRQLASLLDEFWELRLRDDVATRLTLGLPVTHLPDASEKHAQEVAAQSRGLLERLERIDAAALSHEDWLSREIALWECRQAVALQDDFWLQSQLTMRALPLRPVHTVLAALPLSRQTDLDAYLGLVRQYPGLVRELRRNFETARSKGILPPQAMIDVIEPVLRAFIQKPEASPLWVADGRLERLRGNGDTAAGVPAFQGELRRLLTAEVNPALQELADAVAAARPQAPEHVGLGQYPGGEAAYRDLVRFYTTLDVTPEEIHRIGLAEVDRIDARMAELRGKLGFAGTRAEFHRKLRTDERFLAKTPEEVAERLMAPVRRIEPKVSTYFLRTPKAPYGVKRLDPAFEGSTFTFGMYDVPTPADPTGNYRFNGSQLAQRPLVSAAALIYHELIPGHHFQINLQRENESLPLFRRMGSHTAFVEGWAEYASSLGNEMGLYSDPWDEYGRLGMDMFLSNRLVVDTGMNLLGWPRQKAIDYMLDHVLESETQVVSETLRYSADMPGQALAYRMGSRKIRELRSRAEQALGDKFDIRRFHEAVLGSGSMPLSVLEKHIDWWIGEEKKRG